MIRQRWTGLRLDGGVSFLPLLQQLLLPLPGSDTPLPQAQNARPPGAWAVLSSEVRKVKLAKLLKINFPVNFYPSKCPAPHTPYELPEEGKWRRRE